MVWWYSPYPGHGPWRHLPPWERPGWVFGRGWCWLPYWWAYYRGYPPPPYPSYPLSREDEIRYLEELKKYITDVVLRDIESRLKELRGEK
ncbi:MAG: DUF5320 domain-containing protein [Sulfolobales archaeon]